jgi:hypothetical protein
MKSGVQPCKSAGNQLRILRFAEHDFGVWHFFREHACYALQCATSAIAGHPVVEVLAFEVVDDLSGRGPGMDIGVCFIFKLSGQEPAVRFGELDRLDHHAKPTPCLRG